MTDGQIKAALMSRNLLQTGDRATLNYRLLQSDLCMYNRIFLIWYFMLFELCN